MADLVQALTFVFSNEGGYVNNPADPGGETYRGIARKQAPGATWSGWQFVDRLKGLPNFPASLDSEVNVQTALISFYRQYFWRFDGVKSQDVANKALDLGVQFGLDRGTKILQTALRAFPGHSMIQLDGHYGPETETSINSIPESDLLLELRAQMALYYCSKNNPTFIKGWMRRAVR